MTKPQILSGGPPHAHVNPLYDGPGMGAWKFRWNTVVLSSCGHLYVRRHSLGWLFPLCDHFPQWVRLRPWHVMACLKVANIMLRDRLDRV